MHSSSDPSYFSGLSCSVFLGGFLGSHGSDGLKYFSNWKGHSVIVTILRRVWCDSKIFWCQMYWVSCITQKLGNLYTSTLFFLLMLDYMMPKTVTHGPPVGCMFKKRYARRVLNSQDFFGYDTISSTMHQPVHQKARSGRQMWKL
jgi:hypothetical protein